MTRQDYLSAGNVGMLVALLCCSALAAAWQSQLQRSNQIKATINGSGIEVPLGETRDFQIVINNSGSQPARILGGTNLFSCGRFGCREVWGFPLAVPPNSTGLLHGRYTAHAIGTETWNLILLSDDANNRELDVTVAFTNIPSAIQNPPETKIPSR